MKTVCLILTLAGQIVPIDRPFPSADACEMAGFAMTDGQTVKGYACLPRFMVDGMPTFDCGALRPDLVLTPPPGKCTFSVMRSDGLATTVTAPCDADVPGTISITPPDPLPPVPKYQKRME